VSTILVSSAREIAAPPGVVYDIIADYLRHHPHILPGAISGLVVEEGGIGGGTVIRFDTTLAGRTRSFHQRVEEPHLGKILREVDIDGEGATTFTVTPRGDGSHVQIGTTVPLRGARGLIERLVVPRMLRPVLQDELERLDAYARDQAARI
jgi:hypothetical protein